MRNTETLIYSERDDFMIKVDIISGFLGAGKTTFIKELISKVYGDEKIVLIENEFGEIGIDGLFMKESGIEVTEMNSGCICCTLVGDFSKALKKVREEFSPDRIIIEPSGVGKLSDVARAVSDMRKEADADIENLITIVDGTKAEMYMKNFGEFFNNQIEYADTIVISRTQKIDEKNLRKCVESIRTKNEKAAIVTTPWEELSAEAIKEALSRGRNFNLEIMERVDIMEIHEEDHDHSHHHHKENHDNEHHHDHEGHHHADEVFDSWGTETVHKFSRSELEDILGLLSTTESLGNVLRAKGIVEDENGRWVEFDMVPEETEIRERMPDYTGRVCVIGTHLNERELNKIFR